MSTTQSTQAADEVRTHLAQQLHSFLGALPAPDNADNDPATGSLTEPGIYRDTFAGPGRYDNAATHEEWVAWDYDPDDADWADGADGGAAQKTIAVSESDINFRRLEQAGDAYTTAAVLAEESRLDLRTVIRDISACYPSSSEASLASMAGVTRMTVRKALGK